VDRLDVRILREMSQGGSVWPAHPGLTASYRGISRKLGVAPGTVRNRVREMIRTGFLGGVSVYVNPNLLGLLGASYGIEVPSSARRSDALERLSRLPGVVFLEIFRGPMVGLALVLRSEEEVGPTLSSIDRVAHCPRGIFTRVQHPPCTDVLSQQDWRLASRLMTDRILPYDALAGELGVSVRTLKRRMERLLQSSALLTFPKLDFRCVQGAVTADLLVGYAHRPSREHARSKIMQRLEEWMFFAGIWDEFELYRLILPNLALASQLAEEVGRLPGVGFARAELVESLLPRFEHLVPFLERRMTEARRQRPAPSARGAIA
jgi:DNA-binding Lrp family transcriptional regulator